jgi:hypothetical protein
MSIWYPVGDGYGKVFVPEVGLGFGNKGGSVLIGTGLGN